jgi:hypothetical protein
MTDQTEVEADVVDLGGLGGVENTPKRDLVETLSTVLLALAAVATAWSSYQASRWHGEQAIATAHTNSLRIQASRAENLAESETEIDVATFIQWIDASAAENTELADFYSERFRDEFRPAFDAWLATDPFANDSAPPTPFAMPEYRLEATADAAQLDADTEASSAEVRRDIQRASNYVLAVVLFAVALFFAGMSTRLHGAGARQALLIVGSLVFLFSVAWLATFPVNIAV